MIELRSLLNLPQVDVGMSHWMLRDPSRPDAILARAGSSYAEIDPAVRGAGEVFSGGVERVRSAWARITSSKEELLDLLALEQGRTRVDVAREWSALERLVSVWINEGWFREGTLQGWEPRGCAVVLLSSSWPLFHSVKFMLAAWIGGNPVILKPSEQASLTVHRMVERVREGGADVDRVQCLLGDREIGRRLACHESVETVVFIGTFENGMRVRQDTLSRPAKEILLHLGNKNVTVFGRDPGDEAFTDLVDDAFSGAGQDCKSVSLLFLPETEAGPMVERIHGLARAFPVGDPRDGAWMGPMQDPARLDRYLKFIGISEREGASVIMRGKPLPGAGKSWCAAPTLALYGGVTPEDLKRSVALQTEILSPLLSLIPYRDSAHLVALLGVLNHAHTCNLRGEGLPDPGRVPFSRVLKNQSILGADSAVSVHYRKRNGNHALMGLEAPGQFMRKVLK